MKTASIIMTIILLGLLGLWIGICVISKSALVFWLGIAILLALGFWGWLIMSAAKELNK